jgi:hypothetical protein
MNYQRKIKSGSISVILGVIGIMIVGVAVVVFLWISGVSNKPTQVLEPKTGKLPAMVRPSSPEIEARTTPSSLLGKAGGHLPSPVYFSGLKWQDASPISTYVYYLDDMAGNRIYFPNGNFYISDEVADYRPFLAYYQGKLAAQSLERDPHFAFAGYGLIEADQYRNQTSNLYVTVKIYQLKDSKYKIYVEQNNPKFPGESTFEASESSSAAGN